MRVAERMVTVVRQRILERGASLRNRTRHPWIFRLMAHVLVPALVLTSLPAPTFAATSASAEEKSAPPPPPKVKVNRTVPAVTPPPALPHFSAEPTDAEIFRARMFEEPLVPNGTTTAAENRAFADALEAYLKAPSREDASSLEAFFKANPDSPWRTSLLLGVGIVYRRTAHFTKATDAFEQAWQSGKDSSDLRVRATADRAAGELAALDSRLGRMKELEALFAETDRRPIGGSAAGLIDTAKQALGMMKTEPGKSFRCGPLAVESIYALDKPERQHDPRIEKVKSTTRGTSLAQMQALAEQIGMPMQMAFRSSGAEIVVPSLIHWRAGHFAAILRQDGNRYLVQDPTFGSETWVTRQAIEDEASGHFLIPGGKLKGGWHEMTRAEGAAVWGKGTPHGPDPQYQGPTGPSPNPPCSTPPMAVYRFNTLLASLYITDSPVGYSPPVGPQVRFTVSYNQREMFQPQIPYYSNLGSKWTFDWLTYIEDDPDAPAQTLTNYLPGGGQETYTGYDSVSGAYGTQFRSHSVLLRTDSGVYERHEPDGSVEVFGQPDGSLVLPRKVFLTEKRDPQGNSVKLTYDASLRLVAITDSIGQVTTLSYDLPGDPLKITKVTDPFGRFAMFEYDESGRLAKITDVIGITSQFTYESGDFISELTTPYGTTHFRTSAGLNTATRSIEATDPLGGTERVQYQDSNSTLPFQDPIGAPPGFEILNYNLDHGLSLYWDKRAMALYPNDPTKAVLTNWLAGPGGTNTGIMKAEKKPLESRVWYMYPGANVHIGAQSQPSMAGRFVDSPDGSGAPVPQIHRYEYNSRGQVTRETDPLGRAKTFTYSPDGLDLLEVRQVTATGTDLLQSFTYNIQHEQVTVTDASSQTTIYTYNPQGQLSTVTTPSRTGITENRTTRYCYDANCTDGASGYLLRIEHPVAGATITYSYDGYGRVRTTTDADGYTLTSEYDTLGRRTRLVFPDGTYEQTAYNRLDAAQQRDRLGRLTETFVDALRRVIAVRDPLGNTTTYVWCACGSLDRVIDPNGNAVTWERDIEGRLTREVQADNTSSAITYEQSTSRVAQIHDRTQQIVGLRYYTDNRWKQLSYTNTTQPTPTVSFTYDPVYSRLTEMTDGTGTTTYSYYSVTPPTLGALRLHSVDGPLANDTVTYTYDELDRVVSRDINGVRLSWAFDALGRVTEQAGAIGTFTYAYDGVTNRLASLNYPNGQTTVLSYFGNEQDHLLQDLHNERLDGSTLSRFQYTYTPDREIATWTQQADNNPSRMYDLGHDALGQLTTATLQTTDPAPIVLKRYGYGYDRASNRTSEEIDDAGTSATVNVLNAITALQPGGTLRFRGSTNEAATVTVQGRPAQVIANQFAGSATVSSGTGVVAVVATDGTGNTRTNSYQVVESGSPTSLTYDSNGSLISDGTRTLEWDGANRLTAVAQGSHRSEFTYDGWGHRVRIVEKDNGVVTGERRFLWCGPGICEERDATGANVIRRFFDFGMEQNGTPFYYTTDHLSSVRELTDASGTIRARYEYDPYGRATKVSGDQDSIYTFARLFSHTASGYQLASFRAYDATLGRWLNQDPIGFAGGMNVYAYVGGRPLDMSDSSGLLVDGGFTAGTGAALLGGGGAGAAVATGGLVLIAGILVYVAWDAHNVLPRFFDDYDDDTSAPADPQSQTQTQPQGQGQTQGQTQTQTQPQGPTAKPKKPCNNSNCINNGSGVCSKNKKQGPGRWKWCSYSCDDGRSWKTWLRCTPDVSAPDPGCPAP